MRAMIMIAGIGLLHQNAIGRAMPNTGPRLIGPAKAERKIGLARAQHFPKWTFEELPSPEPVVVVAEGLEPIFPRHVCLRQPRFWDAQVVKPEIRRHMRL